MKDSYARIRLMQLLQDFFCFVGATIVDKNNLASPVQRLQNFGQANIELSESIFLIISWNDYRVIWRHETATIIAIFHELLSKDSKDPRQNCQGKTLAASRHGDSENFATLFIALLPGKFFCCTIGGSAHRNIKLLQSSDRRWRVLPTFLDAGPST